MKIIGLLMVRNESAIITDTLDHMATFCDGGVVVYDDCSTDDTRELCYRHFSNPAVFNCQKWDPNREVAESHNRNELLKAAKYFANEDDWFVYMDADERIDFDFSVLQSLSKDITGIRMKLFDFYITPKDINSHYSERKYCGPEYRNILFAFRNLQGQEYHLPFQREVTMPKGGTILNMGLVKHYGKGISVQQWEDTCAFYTTYCPRYAAKWEKRKGKAIHTTSSFGLPLITWNEKEKYGLPLTPEIERRNIY